MATQTQVKTAGTVPVSYEGDAYFGMSKDRIDQTATEIRSLLSKLQKAGSTGASADFEQQHKFEMEQVQNAWDSERAAIQERIKSAQEFLISIDKTYGDQIDAVRERYSVFSKQNIGSIGISSAEETQMRTQLSVLRSKLAALENALISSGYTDYRPIAPVFDDAVGGSVDGEGFFDSKPVSIPAPDDSGQVEAPRRGRPKGSKNKSSTVSKRGRKPGATTAAVTKGKPGRKAATVSVAAEPAKEVQTRNRAPQNATVDLNGAITTAFNKSDKKRLKIVEIADLIAENSPTNPKTGDVLQAVNRMVEQGKIAYDEGSRTYALSA